MQRRGLPSPGPPGGGAALLPPAGREIFPMAARLPGERGMFSGGPY